MTVFQSIIAALYSLVGLGVRIEYDEYTDETREKVLKFDKSCKVIAFKVKNVGTNSTALVGKGTIFERIPTGTGLPFGLDSFFYFCDCLHFKFEATTCTKIENCTEVTPATKHHIIIVKYVVKKR